MSLQSLITELIFHYESELFAAARRAIKDKDVEAKGYGKACKNIVEDLRELLESEEKRNEVQSN